MNPPPRSSTGPARIPHIVIVGGGFGGLDAARALAGAPVRVTLVDRHNYHLFQPLLYQVATASLSPGDIASPIRWILRNQANVTVLLAEVRGGRYADAVARGVALLSASSLTTPQRASVQRQLLEAYAALGAEGRAADACREWRLAAPRARLSPVELSPKLLSACNRK